MRFLVCFLLFFVGPFVWGQGFYLRVDGGVAGSGLLKDLGVEERFSSVGDAVGHAGEVFEKVQRMGFLGCRMEEPMMLNDSTVLVVMDFGRRTSRARLFLGGDVGGFCGYDVGFVDLEFEGISLFLDGVLDCVSGRGFALSKVRLGIREVRNDTLFGDVLVDFDKRRVVDSIVVSGGVLPGGYSKMLRRMYVGKALSKSTLTSLSESLDQFGIVKQVKFPEVLFGTNKSSVFVFVEPSKSNYFDGFVGINSRTDGGVGFTGYLDFGLQNIMKSGEKLSLLWKSTADGMRDFNVSVEFPFVFESSLGLRGGLRIFRQDSTFQNTKTNIGLGYYFSPRSKFFLGYESLESSDIQNIGSATLVDFENRFYTLDYLFSRKKKREHYFDDIDFLDLKVGTGKRDGKLGSASQFYGSLSAQYHWFLNSRNGIKLRNVNYFLNSSTYYISELYRFGGVNSIRGFSENSLQGNLFTCLSSEYRYYLSNGMYAHTVLDYGYYKDSSVGNSDRIAGIGIGFGMWTKNGVFNLIYANGSINNEAIQLRNSLVQISFKARF